MTRSLQPTYRHPEARAYRSPGGPWDLASLDAILTTAAAGARGPLVCDDTSDVALDGAALEAGVAAVAGGLRAQGVRRGDVVAWQAPNCHEVVLLYRARWRLGAIAAPLHHQAGTSDIDRMLAVLAPSAWLPAEEPNDRAGMPQWALELLTATEAALLDGLGEQRLAVLHDRARGLENTEVIAYLRTEADRALGDAAGLDVP